MNLPDEPRFSPSDVGAQWITYARALRSLLAQREETIKRLEGEVADYADAQRDLYKINETLLKRAEAAERGRED